MAIRMRPIARVGTMSRVDLADKLILQSRRLSAVTLLVSIIVMVGTMLSFEAKLDETQSEHIMIFGIEARSSLVRYFGPSAIIFFQFVTWRYLDALSELTKSDKSLYGKVTEPWFFVYNKYWDFMGVTFHYGVPVVVVAFTSFLHTNEDNTLGVGGGVGAFLEALVSLVIAILSGWKIVETKGRDVRGAILKSADD